MKEEVVYFSVNNWFRYEHYPPTKNFIKWLGDDLHQQFIDDEWAKENKLCIYAGVIDMSANYNITAPRSWVEKNCPELLTDEEYVWHTKRANGEILEHRKKYSDFVDHPDSEGEVISDWGWPYLEYKEENFGVHYYDEDPYYSPTEEDSD